MGAAPSAAHVRGKSQAVCADDFLACQSPQARADPRQRTVRSRMAGIARVKLVRALAIFLAACYGALTFAPAARAQAYVVNLDPAQTKITFSLDTTLHDVHGTFQLKSGQIHFYSATAKP